MIVARRLNSSSIFAFFRGAKSSIHRPTIPAVGLLCIECLGTGSSFDDSRFAGRDELCSPSSRLLRKVPNPALSPLYCPTVPLVPHPAVHVLRKPAPSACAPDRAHHWTRYPRGLKIEKTEKNEQTQSETPNSPIASAPVMLTNVHQALGEAPQGKS